MDSQMSFPQVIHKKTMPLEKLSQSISACNKCSLRYSCSQVVVGSGSIQSRVLLIGEAPGKKEDISGIPFVGASGKFLETMLASVGMKRESVFITNIVKCRPPDNRDPSLEEINLCKDWVLQQIKEIDPILIITLGRHSMNFFLPELKISLAHGKIWRNKIPFLGKKYSFLTLYHPAAALYNRKLRTALLTDFKKIPEILSSLQKNGNKN